MLQRHESHAALMGDHPEPLLLRDRRPGRAFAPADLLVAVDTHDQEVAHQPGRLKVHGVALVDHVERPARQDDLHIATPPDGGYYLARLVEVLDVPAVEVRLVLDEYVDQIERIRLQSSRRTPIRGEPVRQLGSDCTVARLPSRLHTQMGSASFRTSGFPRLLRPLTDLLREPCAFAV